jgi:signal transduction histidine kinase
VTDPLGSSRDAFLDGLPQPVEVTDATGVLVFANAAAAARFGADKHVGLSLEQRAARLRVLTLDGLPIPVADHPVARVLGTRQPVLAARVTVETEDGTRRAYVMNTSALFDGPRLAGTVSLLHEQSPRTVLERELADHAARLEAIVNLVSDAVFVVGADGRTVFANAVGERLLGLPAGVALPERARRLRVRTPDGQEVPPEAFPSSRALRGETLAGLELLIVNAGGETRRAVASAHPLRHADGRIYGAIVTINEVTAEAIARQELEAARAGAEEANRLKDEFLAALSHELRAPLQPILGWTEVLRRRGELDEVTGRAVEAIRRNIRQQVRLVDDLLDLSRIVHQKLTLRWETLDLREAVRAAAEPFEEAAVLKRVRMAIDVPAHPVWMWADGSRIQQIASNLVSNAVKFTPAGGRVTVGIDVEGSEAALVVDDTGEGIPPEDLGGIFNAFGQGRRAGRKGGLGLGLDLVRRLTELHGGRVQAASEGPGRGARFTVRLPLTRGPGAVTAPAAAPSRRLDRCSILVIEDNADTRDVLRFMLELEGASVATAETGGDGLSMARAAHPDIVICDIGLPDLDGLEVARSLRQAGGPAPRLIALTGYGQADDVRSALDAGFQAHLTKPVNLDELMALLTDKEPGG